MEKGDIIRAKITDTNENGVGIAKHGGVVVFVPSLAAGDDSDIRITEMRKNYAIGETVQIYESSEHRIAPVCSSCGECGGCSLAHVSYEYENEIKRNTVISALRRAGLPYGNVSETVSAPTRTAYRNKVTVHFDKKTSVLGLYSEETHDAAAFRGCALCPDGFNEIISLLNCYGGMLGYMETEEITLKSSSDGKITIIIKAGKNTGDLARLIKDKFPSVGAVVPFDKAAEKHVAGEYGGLKMRFSAAGFRQVNDEAFALLLSHVGELAGEEDFSSCADLYCGSGVIGLSLAARYPDRQFYGVEINEKSIEDAKYNADANGVKNISFFAGDAASFRKNIPSDSLPSLVIVDPPRAGLSDKMRRELIALSPEKIIYVSCNPQTMARDAKELGDAGYGIKSVTPMNMFPMTKHTESVMLLDKSTK